MTLNKLTEMIKKKRVVRGGKIKKVRKSTRDGYVINRSTGKEEKRTSADKVRLSKIQKKASRKRKVMKTSSSTKRKKSLKLRTWK